MEIFLSINNREKVIKFPHLPPQLVIDRPQGTEVYSTVGGELNLIGNVGIKTISFDSYMEAESWEITYQIELMRRRKLPLRLIVTGTPINIAVTIDSFTSTVSTGNKVYFSISFSEFKFLGGVT